MIPYTDTTISVRVKDVALTGTTVYVTLKQGEYEVTKTATPTIEGTDTLLSVDLTQSETSIFESCYKPIKVQVNWLDGGKRHATTTKTIEVFEQLKEALL